MKVLNRQYLCLLLIIVIFISHAVYLNCVAEDAFIGFRFAKNLANGHGLIWNVGEPPVEGYTNFLWVVLCAFILKLGFNLLLFAQTAGILASIASIMYTYKFAYRLQKFKKLYALIPCLLLAVSGPFATWATSGMETNFFGLFLLIAVYHFVSYWKYNFHRDIFFCFIALFIATLIRPEGFIIFCILLILGWIFLIGLNKKFCKPFLLSIALYIIPFMTYIIWRLKYFGFLFPNTYYAKTGGSLYQYLRGLMYSGYFALYFIFPLFFLIILFLREKGFSVADLKAYFSSIRFNIKNYIGEYTCMLICLIYTIYIIYVGGDYMAMYRFFVPIIPFIYILVGGIINNLFLSISCSPKKKIIVELVFIGVIASIAVHSTPLEKVLISKPFAQHGHFRGVQTERWHSARLSLIGRFFNEYKHNSDESIATGAIGAMSYYADIKIYGFHGLVDPLIAHKKMKNLGLGLPGHEKSAVLYVLLKRPTYFMFSRGLNKKPIKYPKLKYPESSDEIKKYVQENYRLTSIWLTDYKNKEEGYFTFYELKEHLT